MSNTSSPLATRIVGLGRQGDSWNESTVAAAPTGRRIAFNAVHGGRSALLEIPNLRMIQLSLDPNGPDFDTVLTACRPIVESGRKVCFQIGCDANQIRQLFAVLPPESCLFFFGYAKDAREGERILGEMRRLARK